MAAKYDLQPNEVVLLREQNVMHAGSWPAYTNELILTNLNLVLLKKGAFGTSKGALTFPIDQIKVHNNQVQAVIGKAANGMPLLQVYFLNGQEGFGFHAGGKKKVNLWASTISQAVTGTQAPARPSADTALPGAERVAGVLKGTLDVFKSKLGSTPTAAPIEVAGKCRSCGAPIIGLQGRAVTCGYCDSAQQL